MRCRGSSDLQGSPRSSSDLPPPATHSLQARLSKLDFLYNSSDNRCAGDHSSGTQPSPPSSQSWWGPRPGPQQNLLPVTWTSFSTDF